MKQNLGELVDRQLTQQVVEAAVEVHRHLGPGLLESSYRACLLHEFGLRSIKYRSEALIPIRYKGATVSSSYRADVIVEDKVLLELKAVDHLLPICEAQILTYLKLSNLRVGFLMNFNVQRLNLGLRRYVL